MTDDFKDIRNTDLTPADMRERLDPLFQMTQRGPFSGYRPEQIAGEVATLPLTPGGITEDIRFPLYLQGYILGGMYNDRFIHGPPDGDGSTILDVSNKLPGWSLVDNSTGGASATWEQETYDSAYVQFTHDTGSQTDGDEVYLEQLVFVPGGSITILAPSFHAYSENNSVWSPFMESQWVYPDGTLAGSETRTEYSGTAEASGGAIHRTWYMSRTREYGFLRIRYGFTATTTSSGGATIGKIPWGWVEPPEAYDVTLRFGRGTAGADWTPASSNTYAIKLNDIDQNYAASKWTAPSPGLFLSMSVMHDDATGVTNDVFDWYPRVNAANSTDPVAQFNSSQPTYALDQRDLEGVTAFDFARGDKIDIECETGSSYTGPSANWSGTLSLRMVFDNAEDATGGGIGPAGG